MSDAVKIDRGKECYTLGGLELLCDNCGHNRFTHTKKYAKVCTRCGEGYRNISDLLFANNSRIEEYPVVMEEKDGR